jgi:hypothetical protein
MKKITVHAWVQDNAGSYHKPGAQLTVDDKGDDGCITASAADALVKGRCATAHHSDKPSSK